MRTGIQNEWPAAFLTLAGLLAVVLTLAWPACWSAAPARETKLDRKPALRVSAVVPETREQVAPPPIYGPPSPPPPIYGPPSPPSRTPLFNPARLSAPSIFEVDDTYVRPAATQEKETVTPWGWGRLQLERGIPFFERTRGMNGAGRERYVGFADGRQRLFEQTGSKEKRITVFYLLDLGRLAGEASVKQRCAEAILNALSDLFDADGWTVALGGPEVSLVARGQGVPSPVMRDKIQAAMAETTTQALTPVSRISELSSAIGNADYVVVITAAYGEDEARLQAVEGRDALIGSRAPVIVLALGDGEATSRARLLRELAVSTQGAFAWLRRVRHDASPTRNESDGRLLKRDVTP